MIFDGKPTSQITIAEIAALVTNHIAEDQYLDFKAQPYPPGDLGTPELVKDVSAFANATGGYLIIGIGEDGCGRANGFVQVPDADSVRRSIIDRCFIRIEPRLPELDVQIFNVSGKDVIICRVPDSPLKPHCAQPDREHHYFWKRYIDVNKLMSHAEIKSTIQGDAVQREIAELRQELALQRTRETVNRELGLEIDESGLPGLQTVEAFAAHTKRLFLKVVDQKPYLRLVATPLPFNSHDIRNYRDALSRLLTNPPKLREHGWDLGSHPIGPSIRATSAGLRIGDIGFRHLRLYWNGHLEFWTPADNELISWGMDKDRPIAERSFNPMAIIEHTASFVQLAKRVWDTASITSDGEFHLLLHHVKGRQLPPYGNDTYGRLLGLRTSSIGTFEEDDIQVGPERVRISDLPGTLVFRLIWDLYQRVGYDREHVPYFDDQGRYVGDTEQGERRAGGPA